ncbi:MAG: hypothetical protein ABIS01_01675, partial [Ferruginibacter sp.]
PALSQPLLLIRDPIVLWLIILASKRELLKSSIYLTGIVVLGVVSIFTAFFMGHGSLMVALYGGRILLLYFTMIFIIGAVFTQEDVVKMGEVLLKIAIPMALLLGLQFYSPQSAWVNKAVGGGDEGAGFSGALGYFRPPGTFSFTNGNTLFFSLVAPFVLYFWLNPKLINKWILIGATGALVVAIPLSISRGLFFQVVVSVLFLVVAISRNPRYLGKIFTAGIFLAAALTLLSGVSFFKTATEAFTTRLEGANEAEGGVEGVVGDRFLGQLFKAITGAADQSMFGFGIGSGTPFGFSVLKDDRALKFADFEWMRELAELGLMGLFVIGLRVALSAKLSFGSFRKLSTGDMLPWLLTSVGILSVAQGSWHQPTALGFFSLAGGLWMASLRKVRPKKSIANKKILTVKPVVMQENTNDSLT